MSCPIRNKIRPRAVGAAASLEKRQHEEGYPMNSIIYLVGLVVIVMAILSFIGLA
ncbi:hypothetical protein [Devosia lucknowensis]|uniref:hypothetical protein n=1 Tax=Devosia lucknowensis TaxID=1096929 RepID=UPI001483BA0D|nr:hypothetical protein [Devosia lucknowensis]